MSVPPRESEYDEAARRRLPRVIARWRGSAIDWLIGALLVFALFWTVGTLTEHSVEWAAGAWGVVVLVAVVVAHTLDPADDEA